MSALILDPRSPYLLTTFRGFYSTKQYYEVSLENAGPNVTLERPSSGSYMLHYKTPPGRTDGFDGFRIRLSAEASATDPFGSPISLGKQNPYQNLNVTIVCPDAGTDSGTYVSPSVGVSPISAVFTQATYSTTYSATIQNGGAIPVTAVWSGPDCGVFSRRRRPRAALRARRPR